MDLNCESLLALPFSSESQQVRVVTEAWFASQIYCLACDSDRLQMSQPNAIAKDFYCPICARNYELKSSKRTQTKKIVDGAYRTMVERIRSSDPPTLMILKYRKSLSDAVVSWQVDDLTAIHPLFLTESVIEQRKPLSLSARRAGWQGCNLRVDRIPAEGHIAVIRSGKPAPPAQVRELYRASNNLSLIRPSERGWTIQVLGLVRLTGKPIFTLNDVYQHMRTLQQAFPNNHHVEAKIRQQLQVLRELGYLRFSSRGVYEVLR